MLNKLPCFSIYNCNFGLNWLILDLKMFSFEKGLKENSKDFPKNNCSDVCIAISFSTYNSNTFCTKFYKR
ncbi:hypothetical protein D3C86_1372200 [compost metagenome]